MAIGGLATASGTRPIAEIGMPNHKAAGMRTRNRQPMTMHDFEAKHWVIAAAIILLAVGAFAYSWS
jgi:hypothetical protein